ncbi:hypothetical protein L3Q82_009974 [Scortum barcoo]|uniref:Uncharacterized protein n=1 Tax=Scortum barcoo TaxID=214431 RepID=A0ACB8WEP1_9TELE|nr:hypothetical protein L3Q82_009974 [Scortum barcoo]
MPADDKVAILTEDEEEQKRKYVLAEPFNTLTTERPAGVSPAPDAATPPEQPPAPEPVPIDCCERMCLRINSQLLISKIFYFFFYAAYGSLYPLLAVYFKQLGMSASRSGLLVGIRYFIEFCSAPFWGMVARPLQEREGGPAVLRPVLVAVQHRHRPESFKHHKLHPHHHGHYHPRSDQRQGVRDHLQQGAGGEHLPHHPARHHRGRVLQRPSAVTIVDTVTLQYLAGKARDRYGLQRMWGSLGWGLAMLLVGIWIDHTHIKVFINDVDCDVPDFRLHNYKIAFIVFGVLMGVAFIVVATQFYFEKGGEYRQELPEGVVAEGDGPGALPESGSSDQTPPSSDAGQEFHYSDLLRLLCRRSLQLRPLRRLVHGLRLRLRLHLPVLAPGGPAGRDHHAVRRLLGTEPRLGARRLLPQPQVHRAGRTRQFDSRNRLGESESGISPKMKILSTHISQSKTSSQVNKHRSNPVFRACHLQVCLSRSEQRRSSNNRAGTSGCSEFEMGKHKKHKYEKQLLWVLYIGLACNTARYLYISYLHNAWTVLPMEVLQGVTHASVWAACISFLSAAVPAALRTSAQGILQGLHLGLGRGCGAMVGGVFVNYFGAAETFRGIGMASLVILLIFAFIQCLTKEPEEKEDILAENIPVPSSPVPIATIDLVQSQNAVGSPPLTRQAPAMASRKTKHQEEQEDVNKPAWVLSGSPWVTIAFAIFQITELIKMKGGGPPPETQPLQVNNTVIKHLYLMSGRASAEYEAVTVSHRNSSDDSSNDCPPASETPTQPNATHPAASDSNKDQTHPSSDGGESKENPTFTAENTD